MIPGIYSRMNILRRRQYSFRAEKSLHTGAFHTDPEKVQRERKCTKLRCRSRQQQGIFSLNYVPAGRSSPQSYTTVSCSAGRGGSAERDRLCSQFAGTQPVRSRLITDTTTRRWRCGDLSVCTFLLCVYVRLKFQWQYSDTAGQDQAERVSGNTQSTCCCYSLIFFITTDYEETGLQQSRA